MRLLRPPLRARRRARRRPARHERRPTRAASSIAASIPTRPGGWPRAIWRACDDGELYLQYAASEAFGFDDGRLKTADYHTSSGFGLRGVTGETTAFAHANEISAAAIDRAAATLEVARSGQGPRRRRRRARTNQAMYGADDPLGLVPFADKVALCQRIDAAARARDPRVVAGQRHAGGAAGA